MPESELIEYKELWKDEYLKWLCGFANAQGGTLYVGVDDQGKVVGVRNCDKLLEDLPNKISTSLGLIASVNRKTHQGLEYLEIKIPRSMSPVNYHGEFYIRSGTTNQKLTGMALVGFITRKTGVRWEDEVVDKVKVADLDEESFRIFRREALKLKRLDESSLNLPNEELLEKLNLISEGKLKRTAVLLFYKNPSIIQTGSVVQIAKFYENGPEIHYQEVLNGSLLTIADKIVDLIYWKYLKAKLIFEGDQSGDFYPFARTAVREAIINAIAHNCYMFGAPIQIRIEDEEMMISNSCLLPDDLTVDTLLSRHRSLPYNPDLANVFYLAGFIEQWGRGIEKILTACREWGTEPPVFKIQGNTFSVTFKALPKAVIRDPLVIVHAHGTLDKPIGTLDDTNGALNTSSGTLDDTDRDTNDTDRDTNDTDRDTNDTNHDTDLDTNGTNHDTDRDTNDTNHDTDRDTNDTNHGTDEDLSKGTDILDEQVMACLTANPQISQKKLAEQLGYSIVTVKRATRRLVENGRLKRVGSNRKGFWQVED